MKKIYPLLVALAFPFLVNGQISLDATMAPPVNSMFLYNDANVPSPPFTFSKSGISNIWDFSSITFNAYDEDTVYYMNPAAIPGSSAFPTATYATYEAGDESYTFLEVSSGNITALGFYGDPLDNGNFTSIIATPPVQTMVFPYTYGSSLSTATMYEIYATGADIGEPTIDSIRFKSSLFVQLDVIAAGTIVLPSASYPALLERHINTTIDTGWAKGPTTGNQWVIYPGFPLTTIDSAFYWYSDQSLQRYAHALYDDTGLHDVVFFKSQSTTSIPSAVKAHNRSVVYPNPAYDFLDIKGLNISVSEWSILDISGKEIIKGQSFPGRIHVQHLPAGIYFINVYTPAGDKNTLRFVKQ